MAHEAVDLPAIGHRVLLSERWYSPTFTYFYQHIYFSHYLIEEQVDLAQRRRGRHSKTSHECTSRLPPHCGVVGESRHNQRSHGRHCFVMVAMMVVLLNDAGICFMLSRMILAIGLGHPMLEACYPLYVQRSRQWSFVWCCRLCSAW